MWWLYFLIKPESGPESGKLSFIWGYLHYFVFMSAVGVGISANVRHAEYPSHISTASAGLSIAIPVVIFVGCLHVMGSKKSWLIPVALVTCLPSPLVPFYPLIIAAIPVGITAITVVGEALHKAGITHK